MANEDWHRHAWANRFQTALLVLSLVGITALACFVRVQCSFVRGGLICNAAAVARTDTPASSRKPWA